MDIQVKNLSKHYAHQTAVDNISFSVKTGEILGFLGPNGAGKTTTMKMITGYLPIEEGEVLIDGQSIKDAPEKLKKKIGYLQENNPLYLDMPVMRYLKFCADLQGVPARLTEQRIRTMSIRCGLNSEKHKKIGELSKGYRQRVGLAQALIHDPKILVLDEPTTGLDPNQIVEIRKLIRELGKEKTVILSTHILPEVEATCDRILIINKGSIVADGTAASLRRQDSGRETLRVAIEGADTAVVSAALQALPSVQQVETIATQSSSYYEIQSKAEQSCRRDVFSLCVQRQWVLLEMTPLEKQLEDVFRNVTLQ